MSDTTPNDHQEALDLLESCAAQFLFTDDDGNLHHSFMATEERLCEYLVEHGRLEQVSRGTFRFTNRTPPAGEG